MTIRGVTGERAINALIELKAHVESIDRLTNFISVESYQEAAHLAMKAMDAAQMLADALEQEVKRIMFTSFDDGDAHD